MYLGTYQLGDRLPLELLCSALPDAAPSAAVYSDSGAYVAQYLLPPADRSNSPNLFARAVHLDAKYAAGRYVAWYSWAESGSPRSLTPQVFDILPGGNSDGAVIAMYAYHRPHAEFLVQQLDSGKLVKGRNPTV